MTPQSPSGTGTPMPSEQKLEQLAAPVINLGNTTTPKIIKIIGVGGGGGNAVGQMYRDNIPEVRYLVANSDKKALECSPVPDQLQLGSGLGCGGNPEKGREYAEASLDKIDAALDDETKMVFITAGMGGGTGTGASPIIAREARKRGILTVGIVTIPFLFERERQIDKALDGLEALADEVDALLVVNNERLIEIYPDLSVINAFRKADQTLSNAVSSITEIISMHGRIDLDFEDVNTVLRDGGVAVMSSGYGEGIGRITRAIHDAITSPLLNNNDIFSASRLVMSITTSSHDADALKMSEFAELNAFMDRFSPDIETKYGLSYEEGLGDKIKVTILASGFSLYGRNKKRQEAPQERCVADDVRDNRIDRFYPRRNEGLRRQHKFYIFSSDDLRDEAIIEQVERTPTAHRTSQQLSRLLALSNGTPKELPN